MCRHMHKAPLILAIRSMYKLKWKIKIFKERYCSEKGCGKAFPPHYTSALNATTQQFITVKLPGWQLKQWSKTYSSLRPSNLQPQN